MVLPRRWLRRPLPDLRLARWKCEVIPLPTVRWSPAGDRHAPVWNRNKYGVCRSALLIFGVPVHTIKPIASISEDGFDRFDVVIVAVE